MTKPLRFDDEAVEEMEAAAEWYEQRRPNLGLDFLAAIREALERIAVRPKACALVPRVPPALAVRRFILRRFPYSVVFVELSDEVRVLAIAHTTREPGFWRGRL